MTQDAPLLISAKNIPSGTQRVKEGRRRARRLTRWRLDRRKDGVHGFSYPPASLGVAAAWR